MTIKCEREVDELEWISKNDNKNNQSNFAILIENQIASSDKVLEVLVTGCLSRLMLLWRNINLINL